jgi:hypothetical protein
VQLGWESTCGGVHVDLRLGHQLDLHLEPQLELRAQVVRLGCARFYGDGSCFTECFCCCSWFQGTVSVTRSFMGTISVFLRAPELWLFGFTGTVSVLQSGPSSVSVGLSQGSKGDWSTAVRVGGGPGKGRVAAGCERGKINT